MYTVAISGSTGFIGSHLMAYLSQQGFPVVPLLRSDFTDVASLQRRLKGCDAVIHLAGAAIMHRWTKAYKQRIMSSRVDTTALLVVAINGLRRKPKVVISTSGVAIYPREGVHTEQSDQVADSFLGKVSAAWEAPLHVLDPSVRQLVFRLGVVMHPDGGILHRMMLLARWQLLPLLGNQHVPFPWVYLSDLLDAYLFALRNESLRGPVNVVARTYDKMQSLYLLLHQCYPTAITFRISSWLMRRVLGEESALLYKGQYVVADKLKQAGFFFTHTDLLHLYLDEDDA